MPYPKRLLTEGEAIVRGFRPHWRLLAIPALITIAAIAGTVAFVQFVSIGVLELIVLGAAIVIIVWWGIRPFIHWWFTHYVLTNERLIRRAGFIARRGVEIPLENINDVQFSQTVLERILRSGDLLIESAGEMGQSRFSDIPEPEEFQSLIYRVREQRSTQLRGAPAVAEKIDPTAQLERLARLHDEGRLTDEEFAEKKQKLLDQL